MAGIIADHNTSGFTNADLNFYLPIFWRHSPAHWFVHADAVFAAYRVTSNIARVNYLVVALDEDGIRAVSDLLGRYAVYDDLRARLVETFGVSRVAHFRTLVQPDSLGDRRPSQLLRDMRSTIPEGIGEKALTEFWLQKLPSNVRAVVAGLVAPLDDLAARADRVMEACSLNANATPGVSQRIDALEVAVQELSKRFDALLKRRGSPQSLLLCSPDNKTPSKTKPPSKDDNNISFSISFPDGDNYNIKVKM